MPNHRTPPGPKAAGFTLPSILVVVSALLILAVGLLLVVSIERSTSRSFVDRQRATLAAKAGLEQVKGTLGLEAANDDFLVVQNSLAPNASTGKDPIPYLYIARGNTTGGSSGYRYLPMFSNATAPAPSAGASNLEIPDPKDLVGTTPKEFSFLPKYDSAKLAWIQVPDAKGRIVARYAYWVEDLQSRVDAGSAGNTKDAGSHKRYGWKAGDTSKFSQFPAPGLNAEDSKPKTDGRDAEPPLDQVALYTLDPATTAKDTSTMDKTIIDGRKILVSPDSVLAVAGITPPLTRGTDGHLSDAKSRNLEEGLTAKVQPYDEQPLVPFAKGIDASVVGKPKLNLNALLAKPAATAVDEMAAWINKALPTFEERKGGFPDNYLKTLAANAIDYADTDKDAAVSTGITQGAQAYRGLDAYPLLSEVILHIKYKGPATAAGRKVLLWQMLVFVELWNHTNIRVTGNTRVSYENKMRPPAIGTGVSGDFFDAPSLMGDPKQVQPTLSRIGDKYWSPSFAVDLVPNQYKFYKAVTLNYTMDVGPASQSLQNQFEIFEDGGASGISMMWNDKEVDRSDKLVRGNSDPLLPQLEYITNFQKQSGKANIPGHSYGYYNKKDPSEYRNNMGDSRQALYLRGPVFPLSDNSYPGNVSPNRRNIRNFTIYKNGSGSSAVYGRVLPSEWPDGGHDVPVTGLAMSEPAVNDYDPSNTSIYPDVKNGLEGDTPTFLSNRGRFYSATELGRIFDPIMYKPTYDDDVSTKTIFNGEMPKGKVSWPSVEAGSPKDVYYGGGNTLRIGRPEHPKFDQPAKHAPVDMPGNHAARLLDLFHAGKSRSATAADREGSLVRIEGHVNINTASADAIRAMAGGFMMMDPRLAKRTSDTSHSSTTFAPPISSLQVSTATKTKEADVLAQAIIDGRPYASPSEIASALTPDDKVAFGNRDLLPDGNKVQWSDAAAEEAFGRVYEASTVRSRNFRVWVVGQALAPTVPTNTSPEVMAEVRRAFTVFADPGERKSDGSVNPDKFHVTILNENDF